MEVGKAMPRLAPAAPVTGPIEVVREYVANSDENVSRREAPLFTIPAPTGWNSITIVGVVRIGSVSIPATLTNAVVAVLHSTKWPQPGPVTTPDVSAKAVMVTSALVKLLEPSEPVAVADSVYVMGSAEAAFMFAATAIPIALTKTINFVTERTNVLLSAR